MIINKETIYSKDAAAKKMKVVREFDAPADKVWKAWTEPALLDQWWAPKPWKANTQSMDLHNGGKWFYYMEGPAGERHYCMVQYESITPGKSFSGLDAFCDEKGNINADFPSMHWKVDFTSIGNATKVEVEITFASEADMEKIVEMGFKEGFAMAHQNLDELLAA
jgi:uncharacterized protein YndB with AHSA1/START domain